MTTKIIGGKELLIALEALGKEAGQKGGPVKNALRAAAKPVLDAQLMEAAKHVDTGDLFASLKILRHPNPLHLNEIMGVGVHSMGKRPEKGQDQNTGKPWYAQIIEYGGRGGNHPLKGFMRRSLENNRDKSVKIYTVKLAAGIKKIARKIARENATAVNSKANLS